MHPSPIALTSSVLLPSRRRSIILVASVGLRVRGMVARPRAPYSGRHARAPAQSPGALMAAHARHGNPPDLRRLMRRQLATTRARWQQPERVLKTLRVRRGAVVADVGSGPGYFTTRLARAVGPRGRVYAVDPEPEVLKALVKRLDGTKNVTPVLSREYDRLVDQGFFDDERLELLDGLLVVKEPQGSRHASTVIKIRQALERAFGPKFHCREHAPIALDRLSEPEPDVAVVRGRAGEYV